MAIIDRVEAGLVLQARATLSDNGNIESGDLFKSIDAQFEDQSKFELTFLEYGLFPPQNRFFTTLVEKYTPEFNRIIDEELEEVMEMAEENFNRNQ